jgi:hypothetical protein
MPTSPRRVEGEIKASHSLRFGVKLVVLRAFSVTNWATIKAANLRMRMLRERREEVEIKIHVD